MIVSMRRVAQRGGILSAACLAVLGIVVLLHLGLCITHDHSAHHHEPGTGQSAAECDRSAELHVAIDAVAFPCGSPCPQIPAGDDHSLCGAAAGSPIVNVRDLLPGEHAIGDSTTVEATAAASRRPTWRSSQPAHLPPGAALLLLKSVSRI
ncbi:hypothetical protein [Streptosporangium roseum]|uniref:hypothetical protein n=1 Tax=Streptosporangium roseum TaxID=2001 RepID=UPI0012DE2374|nr:hypothetical protein [Streptosporangium roseum]